MSFTWIPLYSEIARKVLEFQDRQNELLGLLGKLLDQGLKVISLTDRDANGKEIPLGAIDPFTFFASFNRTPNVSGRQAILAKIKDAWLLPAEVPEDFDGIPIINPQNSWAFAFLANRQPDDIPILWQAAREGIEKDWRAFDRNLFDKALGVRQMGLTRLTMSLFWVNPNGFLSFDKNTEAYFENHKIVCKSKSAAGYFAWLEQAVAKVGDNFPQISLDSYEADGAASLIQRDKEDKAHGKTSPTSDAPGKFWVEKTYIEGRPDRNEGETAFGAALWSPQAGSDGRNTYRLMRDVKPGDVVFHFVDGKEILGVSRVASDLDDTFVVPEGTQWPAGNPAFLIQLKEYSKLSTPIDRSEFLENPQYRSRLLEIVNNHDSLFFKSPCAITQL